MCQILHIHSSFCPTNRNKTFKITIASKLLLRKTQIGWYILQLLCHKILNYIMYKDQDYKNAVRMVICVTIGSWFRFRFRSVIGICKLLLFLCSTYHFSKGEINNHYLFSIHTSNQTCFFLVHDPLFFCICFHVVSGYVDVFYRPEASQQTACHKTSHWSTNERPISYPVSVVGCTAICLGHVVRLKISPSLLFWWGVEHQKIWSCSGWNGSNVVHRFPYVVGV